MLLYQGPSLINGGPIVAVGTPRSTNIKTGDVIQTWILPADIPPHHAVKDGTDSSVCGNCPHRHFKGGSCYVLPFQAPRGVWTAWKNGSYEKPAHKRKWNKARNAGTMVRLGAYGDPAAVPDEIWRELVEGAIGWTGYTHQWAQNFAQPLRDLCMASVDTQAQAVKAAAMGWRYFQVVRPGVHPPGTVECLSTSRGTSCAECRLCNGARDKSVQPTSIYIEVHGQRAKRFKSLEVL